VLCHSKHMILKRRESRNMLRLHVLVLLLSSISTQCLAMDYRYFVAGGVCAATSHGITTPIDVIKTKMQAEPENYKDGILASGIKVVKTEGPGALLGGLGPTVVGYGIEGACKFGCYEVLKPVLRGVIDDQTVAYVVASIAAGAIASLLLCPMESTRIRIVTDKDYADKGLIGGLPKLIREEGFIELFGGFSAMLAKQVPYTMAKQVSFDIFAALLYSLLKDSENDLKFIVSVTAAAAASILACMFSQPGDMILTETYKGKQPGGFVEVLNKIWGRGGLRAFFVGTDARLIHVGSIITSQLVIYDIVKQLLGLPATGSH